MVAALWSPAPYLPFADGGERAIRRISARPLLRLPEPMLAKPGPIPVTRGWLFEPQLDGFRCLACTHGRLRVRSRRGWDMTPLLPELQSLPENVQLDGEIDALDENALLEELNVEGSDVKLVATSRTRHTLRRRMCQRARRGRG
jgi:ATP-dependent DNA ligase